ncbi:MAG: leucine-rich repeat protein [Candidatus Gracilibacteria bacterium]
MGYLSSFQFLKRVFGEKKNSGEERESGEERISGKKRSFGDRGGFTLTELIVVITILSILSVIGFVVMSHQSSVARDGKRISDIKTLSESARITSAQLRKLPTPIADSVSLSVSGSFIGYQGFMSLALVNPLGYGSDKIFDPKDNIPYTYRVNQHYDQAQFLAYLENPRFERTIEIAGRKFHGNEKIGMNEGGLDGGGSGRGDDNLNRGNQEVGVNEFGGQLKGIQETASQSLPETFSDFGGMLSASLREALPRAYALDSSNIDLSSRYPYSAGDRLGIFLSKGSKQPLQNGVTGTGSRDISLSDASTLDIMVGSQGADEYVSMDISTGSLLSLKDGSFDEKALLGMNSGTGSGSGSGGGDSGGGGGGPVSHILTMGEYSIMGNTYYGYIGPLTISLYATFGVTITTVTPGSLVDDTVDGYVIDSMFANSTFSAWQTILAGTTNMPASITFETPYASIACTSESSFLDVTPYSCTGSTTSTDFYVGSQHELEISLPPPEVVCTNASNVTDESYFTFNSYAKTITGYDQINGPKDVVIPCSIAGVPVTTIGHSAFYQKGLTSVALPDSITTIASYAFQSNQITSVSFGSNILAIGVGAFDSNALTSIEIPDNVTFLATDVFANNQITSLIVPNNVTDIGNRAFLSNQITSLSLPNTLTNISGGAFNDNLLPDNGAWIYARTATGVDISKIVSYGGLNKNITIPSNIQTIGEEAFYANNLESVSIPNSVTNIEEWGFRGNNLSNISIPSSVMNIGGMAFANNQLSSVDIPTGISVIEDNVFQSNELTSITIPSHINTIGANAFHNNKLDNIYLTNSLTSVGANAFGQQSNNQNGTVYGPASGYVKDVYTNNLNNEFDKVRIPNYIDLP